MLYLVAYDIGHPRRLRRVARCLERHAVRCQKSVFLFRGAEPALHELLEGLRPLLRPDEDVVQAWLLSPGQSARGLACGTPLPVTPGSVVLSERHRLFLSLREL